MDQSSFDRLARLLGEATDRRAGLKAALGAIFGAGATSLAFDADAKNRKERDRKADETTADKHRRRRKTCRPACESGFECMKQGKQRVCVCASGVECGGACCAVGKSCIDGACVPNPGPEICIAFGEPCKNVGKRCCDGLACGSGQDGSFPIACYTAAGGSCASSADCGFGNECLRGVCTPVEQPIACVADGGGCANGETCCAGLSCESGICTGGNGCPGAVNLGLGAPCTETCQCATGLCWYQQDSNGASTATTKFCVMAEGGACDDAVFYSPSCGLGNYCVKGKGTCSSDKGSYPLAVAIGATGCSDTTPCEYSGNDRGACIAGTCYRNLRDRCDPAAPDYCEAGSTCQTYSNSKYTGASTCAGGFCTDCAVSADGEQPYSIQEALDLKVGEQYVYAPVTIAPGLFSTVNTPPLATVTRDVAIEACVPTLPPNLRTGNGTGTVLKIDKSLSGPRVVTLRNLALGTSAGNLTTNGLYVVNAIGGDNATEKLTLTIDKCTGTVVTPGSSTEAPFRLDDGYIDATFSGCTFQGATIQALSTRTTSKNSVTVNGSTFTGSRQNQNFCSATGGNPRGFTVSNVKLTIEDTTIQNYGPLNTLSLTANGAGIQAQGGAEIVLRGSTQIKLNAVFPTLYGGGIYFDQSGVTNTLELVTVDGKTPQITQNVAGNPQNTNRGTGIYLSAAPAESLTWADVFKGGVTTTAVSGNLSLLDCATLNSVADADNQCRTPSGPCTFNT